MRIPVPDERSSLVSRNVKVHGHRTSVRLEPQMWDSMIEICRREFCTPDDVCSYVAERKPTHGSLSSSLRAFMLDYFHKSSTEDGHMSAGHGQSMFMSQQQDRWLMRDIQGAADDKRADGLRHGQQGKQLGGAGKVWRRRHGVDIPDDNANLSANRQKQDLAIDVGLGLRTPRRMANIAELENMRPVQPVEKIMAKKKTGKAETSIRVIKDTLTKSALINLLAEENDIPRKTAIGVFNTLESVMLGSVHPRGVGEFTLPGLCKITLRKVPARKAGTLVRNPATGEMMKGAAKPASVRVRIRALSKLKSAAIS